MSSSTVVSGQEHSTRWGEGITERLILSLTAATNGPPTICENIRHGGVGDEELAKHRQQLSDSYGPKTRRRRL